MKILIQLIFILLLTSACSRDEKRIEPPPIKPTEKEMILINECIKNAAIGNNSQPIIYTIDKCKNIVLGVNEFQ